MSAYRGFKLFRDHEIAAIFNEFKQLNEGEVPGKPI